MLAGLNNLNLAIIWGLRSLPVYFRKQNGLFSSSVSCGSFWGEKEELPHQDRSGRVLLVRRDTRELVAETRCNSLCLPKVWTYRLGQMCLQAPRTCHVLLLAQCPIFNSCTAQLLQVPSTLLPPPLQEGGGREHVSFLKDKTQKLDFSPPLRAMGRMVGPHLAARTFLKYRHFQPLNSCTVLFNYQN